MKGDIYDPKALIREAYRIENITRSECRSIFLDWALSLPIEQDPNISIRNLLERYKISLHPFIFDNKPIYIITDGVHRASLCIFDSINSLSEKYYKIDNQNI